MSLRNAPGAGTLGHRLQILLVFVVAAVVMAGSPAVFGASGQASDAGNPLLGYWRMDHVQPLAEDVDQSGLHRIKRAVRMFKTLDIHFQPQKLTLTRPDGHSVTYQVDYRIDQSDHAVIMIQHREKETVRQTYHFDEAKPNRMYVKQVFPDIGRVHMVYRRVSSEG